MVVAERSSFPNTVGEIESVLHDIAIADDVVIDTETTGLKSWHGDRLCGIGVTVDGEVGHYFPFRHTKGNLDSTLLHDFWEAIYQAKRVVGYNLKFDMGFFYQDGYSGSESQSVADILVAARMCSSERFPKLSLTNRLDTVLGYGAGDYEREFKDYLRKNKLGKKYHLAPVEVLGEYCIKDVLGTWALKDRFEEIIEETHQEDVWAQEQLLTQVLWDMECTGIGYDEEYGKVKIPQLKARIANLYNEVWALAGGEFNLNSNPQLTKVMTSLGVKSTSKSAKTGAPSWSNGVMLTLDHPIAGKVVEIRGLEKVLGTYFEAIMAWPQNTVHGQLKNWGTITGRLSGANPNLQNIAKNVQNLYGNEMDEETLAAVSAFLGARKGESYTDMTTASGGISGGITLGGMMAIGSGFDDNEESVSVRRLFVGRKGYRLYMLDYSQMEIRVLADYVQDENLTALLERADFDFHSHVAKTVWGVNESSSLWDFYRTLAKAINFGLIYGIGIDKLASQIQKSKEEAREYRIQYFDQFPKVREFINQVIEVITHRGYVFNRFKRRYWIDPEKAYVGVNYLIQGTSADIVKNRMIACQDYIKANNLKSRMLVQVHDEIIFEIHQDEESWVPWKMQEIMEERQISTFLPVEVSRGCPSWASKETWDREKEEWKSKK